MPLPTDNETPAIPNLLDEEGHVAITEAPSAPAPSTIPAAAPRFMRFTDIFRERWLWLGILITEIILLLSYQLNVATYVSPDFFLSFNSVGEGWHSADRYSNGHLWTDNQGVIYFRNFGYTFSNYKLNVSLENYGKATDNFTHTVTVEIGQQVVGTVQFELDSYQPIPVSADLLRANGPDIPVTLVDATTYPAGVTKGFAIWSLNLTSTPLNSLNPALPPLSLVLIFPLVALLEYSIIRRSKPARKSATNSLILFYPTAPMSFAFRSLFLLFYGLALLLVALLAAYRWRRELANWLLHLRHPEDERFRMA